VAEIIILEFQGIGKQEYDAVNRELGIDIAGGTGDWPPGLRCGKAGVPAPVRVTWLDVLGEQRF
jgi:hypothetical protein